MTYVDLRPDATRPVQVLHDDGRWYAAELLAYRQTEGVWSGFVHYTVDVGEAFLRWLPEDRIQDAGAPA